MPSFWRDPRPRGRSARSPRPQNFLLRVENLESRDVPAPLLGLTQQPVPTPGGAGMAFTSSLVSFDSDAPSMIASTTPVTGLMAGDQLVGIDFRPSTGQLYGVAETRNTGNGGGMGGMGGPPANGGHLYTINPATGAATVVGMAFTPALTTASGTLSVGFNPVVDRLRVVSGTGQNLAINPDTGAVTQQTNLAFSPTSIDNSGPDENAGKTPNVVAIGYTNGFQGATVTTLYGIDATAQELVEIGGPDGAAPPISSGTTYTVEGGLPSNPPIGFVPSAGGTAVAFSRVDPGTAPGDPGTGGDPMAPDYVVNTATTAGTGGAAGTATTTLYSLNPSTGLATPLGTVGGGTTGGGGTTTTPLTFLSLTAVPPATGAGALQFATGAYTLNSAGEVTLVVNRVGGATGTVSVNYATMDGTAVGGRDYAPQSGTLTFGPGVMTRYITLNAVPDLTQTPTTASSTFSVVLSAPGGGGTLGTPPTATVTISPTALPPVPPPGPGPVPPPVPVAGPVTPQSDGTTLVQPTTPTVGNNPVPTGPSQVALLAPIGPVRLFAVGAGPGGGPAVSVYNAATGALVRTFYAFEPTFTGGVQVAVGDVTGNGYDDIIVGAGNGGGPLVKVFDGMTGNLIESFFTFEPSFRGGVNVAVGDVNGDGISDIITGAGVGGGPRVAVFDGATGAVLQNFFAYDPSFRDGVNVAAGHFVTGGTTDDIATAPGFGGGPNVKVFNGMTAAQEASFFAYDQGFTGGVSIAAGDTNSQGMDEIVTGPGAGGGPDVRTFDVSTGTAKPQARFSAYPADFTGGVSVGTVVNGAGQVEILTGPGPGGGPVPRLFNPATGAMMGTVGGTGLDPTFRGGVNVG